MSATLYNTKDGAARTAISDFLCHPHLLLFSEKQVILLGKKFEFATPSQTSQP